MFVKAQQTDLLSLPLPLFPLYFSISYPATSYFTWSHPAISQCLPTTLSSPPARLLMCCLSLQAGVARSRSLEEVAELEQALFFLIKRSADIADAKAAKLHAQLHSATITDPSRAEPGAGDTSQPHRGHAEDTEADKLKSGRNHAEHAEGDSTKSESEELGVSEPSISASSELIDPEVEKLLPKSAHRVSTPSTAETCKHMYKPIYTHVHIYINIKCILNIKFKRFDIMDINI